jgi:HEAT repeat protein
MDDYELAHFARRLGIYLPHAEEVVEFLTFLTKHKKPYVRECAVYSLSRQSCEKSHAVLLDIAKNDESDAVREAAEDALITRDGIFEMIS